MDPTFASFLTPAGIVVAGALVTGTIEVIKATFPAIGARISGALMAFAITLVLYIATAIAVPQPNADGFLNVFMSWLACATASIGIHGAVSHVQAVATQ